MSDVIVVAIWDKSSDVYTRPIVVDKSSKELKFKGKKPNKIIVPESLTNSMLLKKVKQIGSYDCKIIKAVGK